MWSRYRLRRVVKAFLATACALFFAAGGYARAAKPDSRGGWSGFWHTVRPEGIVAQYAGGIGMVSAGAEWVYGRRGRLETGFLAGYVPPFSTGSGKLTLTLRQTYVPFRVAMRHGMDFQPLSLSFYANVITGNGFWMSRPWKNPQRYYGFSSRLRFGLSAGQRLSVGIPRGVSRVFGSAIFYYDLNTCDLDIATFASDSRVGLWDIVDISLGLKLRFRQ